MKRRILSMVIVLAMLTVVISGCASGEPVNEDSADKTYKFQVGHVVTTDHSYHLGLLKFAELAKEKSGGLIELEIFPSAQLGNERDLVEGITMGSIDMTLAASGNLATFIDSYQVFDLPFIFRDNAHAHAVLDGEIGQEAMKSLESIGIVGLSNWENGFYCTWNAKRPIEHP